MTKHKKPKHLNIYDKVKLKVLQEHSTNPNVPIEELIANELKKDEHQNDIEDTCLIFDITKSELAQNISTIVMEGLKNDKPNQTK